MASSHGEDMLGPPCDQGGWAVSRADRSVPRMLVANYDCDDCDVRGREPVPSDGGPVMCWNCGAHVRPTSHDFVRSTAQQAG